jgi:DnaK suppressor protein
MSEYVQPEGAESAGLDAAQLEHLRDKLLAARAEALARLRDQEAIAATAERLPEPMDAAELAREQGDAAMLVELGLTRLREIDAALERMDAGRYGLSERSGAPIGFDRLDAVPWARTAADEEALAT